VRLEISFPDPVSQGEDLPVTLRLSNPSAEPAMVYIAGRPAAFDIVITRLDGTPVWRRLTGAVISAILQVRVLAPQETLEFSHTWKQQDHHGRSIPPGEYRLTGVLPGDPPEELRSNTARLRILPSNAESH
jgi:Intracellular proteinase inhibitor